MRITPTYNFNNYNYKNAIASKGNARAVVDKNNNLLYRTTTYFFREDLDWDNFFALLKRKYQNVPKVNFINHCCSNGEETYSCISGMKIHLGEDFAKKFFPIIAKDINKENIDSAKNYSKIGISPIDYRQINYYTNFNIHKFFDFVRSDTDIYDAAVIPKEELRKCVKFENSDILDDIDKLPDTNSVLLCRNFWPYLDAFKREEFASKLEKKLDERSLLVIGDYDIYEAKTDELLIQHNFIPTTVKYVFTKAPKI